MEDGRRILRILLNILIPAAEWILVCAGGLWLLKFFMPFVIGWLIAMVANPLVRLLERRLKLVRKHSSVLIVVAVLAGIIGGLYFLIGRVIIELRSLAADMPEIYGAVRLEVMEALDSLNRLMANMPLGVQEWFNRTNENLGGIASSLMQRIAFPTVTVAGNVARGIPAVLVNSIVVILSSYFFIVEQDRIWAFVRKLVPKTVNPYMQLFKKDLRNLIGGYFLAQFRIMFVVAVVLAAGFLILGVRYGILLAILIAILDFLPLFGTGTALFPWAVVKLLSGETAFAAGLILLYVLTQVVRQIIQPKIVGDSMGLPPLLTLFFLYVGFKLHGLSGMILAVPIGLVGVKLYEYGALDSVIEQMGLLIQEINKLRKED
ncbi:MAG: sporulation integral membrane protein YtvI [Hungatella sp.]|nr:sporulation integral membrane protein YtvI [Hungatella sp.]